MRRIIAALLLSMQLAGCGSWKRQPRITPEVVAGESRARVLLRDGTEEDLLDPRMAGDTLYGFQFEGSFGHPIRVERAVLADSVIWVRLWRSNALATGGLALLVFLSVIACAGGTCSGQ